MANSMTIFHTKLRPANYLKYMMYIYCELLPQYWPEHWERIQ